MFFLAGAAASSALDLISSLQQALSGNNSAPSTGTFAPAASTGTSTDTQTPTTPTASGAPAAPLSSSTLNALFSMQGQGGQPMFMVNGNALSQQMFSLLDGNGDGAVSQSEFDAAFGQNANTTQANKLFAQIDTNGDGLISLQELTNALDGQDQAQGPPGQGQGVQGHHHHHHHGSGLDIANLLGGGSSADAGAGGTAGAGAGDTAGAGAGGSAGAGAGAGLGANTSGDTTQTVTIADGSMTTTITYADGSQVTMTVPAANGASQSGTAGAGAAASLNNLIEQMIQRQAQLLASSSAGQALAVSA